MVEFKQVARDVYKVSFDAIFTYSTVRLAKIHSVKIALIFRLLQLIIIGYIIGFLFIFLIQTIKFLEE